MPGFSIKREDRIRLQHMLDGALEIQQYVQSSVREDLEHFNRRYPVADYGIEESSRMTVSR